MHKHPSSKKQHQLIIRLLIYALMILSTLVISALCILLVLGYRFNLTKHTVAQGGLLQFDSQPASAQVELDGQQLSAKTPTKKNVTAGQHAVAVTLDGYRPWSKTVGIEPGQLVWLNYTRFVPTNISTSNVKDFKALSQMLASPDRKYQALWLGASMPEMVLANVSDSLKPKFTNVELPSKVLTKAKSHKFSLQEWDFSSRYLLLDHSYGSSHEFILIDREHPAQVVNLNKRFGLDITNIHFADTSGNHFYALVAGDLRRFDLGSKTISSPLAKNVISFSPYGDSRLSYVAKANTGYDVGVVYGDQVQQTGHYETKSPVASSLTKYFAQTYLAVQVGKGVVIYKDPFASEAQPPVRRIKLSFNADWLAYSASGRFLLAGAKDKFMTYDGDTKTVYHGQLDGARSSDKPFLWLDDYHFVTTGNNRLRMVEFDGANPEFIATATAGFDASLSANGKFMYSVVKNGKFYSLQSSQMVIKP